MDNRCASWRRHILRECIGSRPDSCPVAWLDRVLLPARVPGADIPQVIELSIVGCAESAKRIGCRFRLGRSKGGSVPLGQSMRLLASAHPTGMYRIET